MCELGYGKPRFYLNPKPIYALRIFDTQISYDILGKMTLFLTYLICLVFFCRFPIGRATRTKTGVTWTSMRLSLELVGLSMRTTTTRTRAASTLWTPRDRSAQCTEEEGSSAVEGEISVVTTGGIRTKIRETRPLADCRCSARLRRTKRGMWNQ